MEKLVKILKALGDKNRLRIIKMLQKRQLCVGEITQILGLATSTVSKHLSVLRGAGIVNDTKDGKWAIYHLNHSAKNLYISSLMPLISFWLENDHQIKTDMEKVHNNNFRNP